MQATGESERTSSTLEVDDTQVLLALAGPKSDKLRLLEREAHVEASLRGNTIFLRGAPADVALAERFLSESATLLRRGIELAPGDVPRALRHLRSEAEGSLDDLFSDV